MSTGRQVDIPHAEPVANREEPLPTLVVDSEVPSAVGTPIPDERPHSRRHFSASRLRAKLEESGLGTNGIQDRLFSALFTQIFPDEADKVPAVPRDQRSVKYVEKPQFSLPQMSTNFRRFNARIGVVFVFQNRMIRLFAWKTPSHTLSFLAVYTFICLDPTLLVALPLAVCLMFIMVPSFMARHPPPPNADLTDAFITHGPAIAPPPTVKPAPEMSRDFFRNMRDLQNSMEDFSVIHDQLIAAIAPLTNFSDEKLSSTLFLLLFIACCTLFIAAGLIPFRAVALLLGWAAIGSSHPAIAEYLASISPKHVEAHQSRAKIEFENWVESDVVLDEEPEKREVEVFELQRQRDSEWEPWLYSASPFDPLSPARIGGDRPHGARFFEDVQAPDGWVWSDKKWSLDLYSREWVEDRMITSVEIETEGERWVYDVEREITSPAKSKPKKPDWEEGNGQGRQGEWRRRRWVRLVQRKVR